MYMTIPFRGVYATSGNCAVFIKYKFNVFYKMAAPLAAKAQNRSLKDFLSNFTFV